MKTTHQRSAWPRRLAWSALSGLLLVVALCTTLGCSSLGYYAQSVSGHLDLVGRAKPVSTWLQDETTPVALKDRLALTQRMRDFAVQVLHLPDNDSYRRYADLQRSAAVWNVVAARPLSLQLKTWCFPMVGCVGYRGYFRQADAQAYAQTLRDEGWEVSVYGVPAYSTLGRLPGGLSSDPLLNTFIRYNEGELARMLFHELSHQVAYADNDTVFNESFATAVERLGSAQWLAAHADAAVQAESVQINARREAFKALTGQARQALQTVFESDRSDAEKLARKAEVMAQLRADYAVLRAQWGGYAAYDGWFERANNASLGVLSAYNALVPDFEQLFERSGRDYPRFYDAVRRLAALPDPQARRAALSSAAWPGGSTP